MRTFSKGFVVVLFGALLGLAACDQQEGPMEEAGEKVDQAVDDMSNEGTMEKAGESADETWQDTKEAGEDALNKTKEAGENAWEKTKETGEDVKDAVTGENQN
ncbi:hypothetical protein MA04_00082 [Alcanivorax balearicus MACL04]|uniref:Late embryogenesis abundant protein n=1 Tax=Alloalcanivorax balearicus MACL04 TaxID=1177182 RepID=A0ABT2QTH3_9GAMM|nr:hypothetical protein [Alloalcanivorax balearicus]MCU5780782.1 hypothetical protein [Alloalcanivorax balearicus MACL04]